MTVLSTDANDLHLSPLDHSQSFLRMIALIQDEIDDTTAEYSTQIQDSILTALRLCEREPFFFNEKRTLTFKTQRGKTWYGQEEGIFIESERDVEAVLLGTHETPQEKTLVTQLVFKPREVLQKHYGAQFLQLPAQEIPQRIPQETPQGVPQGRPQGTSQGRPLFYTYHDQKIGLFPTPIQVETVRVFYAPAPFGEECLREEDNPWFTHAFDLIKARAKYELYKNILKDPEYAAVSFSDFQEQLQALRFETSRRKGAANILPMRF
ncbi:hypothetical protein ME1_00587 [Bartonella vinsonii subsp. arupensis OK-94-513]|uniref:Uncharacterized protein n=1 Tax=Bartonella vinsonii subsp. arupensis OK-94-513 TaxID=1094562 RepID=J1JUA1_BARVI|nr:hypothetical protein [Bartonella vinsonii]EJF88502.1 hypothetical protein ME1_00587 [Bartonella vinsonii subsp. arupensis OK-94-513]